MAAGTLREEWETEMERQGGAHGDMNFLYWILQHLQLGLKRLTDFGIKCPPSYFTAEGLLELVHQGYYRCLLQEQFRSFIAPVRNLNKIKSMKQSINTLLPCGL